MPSLSTGWAHLLLVVVHDPIYPAWDCGKLAELAEQLGKNVEHLRSQTLAKLSEEMGNLILMSKLKL